MANYNEKYFQEFAEFKEFVNNKIEILERGDRAVNVYDILLGNWNVSDQNVEKFVEKYEKVIKSNCNMHTYERSSDVRGLMIDLDIYQNSNHVVYTDEFMKSFAKELYIFVCKLCGISYQDRQTDRIVMTRKEDLDKTDRDGQRGKMYKDGVHILFPSMRMTKNLRIFLTNEIKKFCPELCREYILDTSIIQDGEELMRNDSDFSEWIDINAATVPTLLLGSQKTHTTKKPHVLFYSGEIRLCGKRGDAELIASNTNPFANSLLVLKYPGLFYRDYKTNNEMDNSMTKEPLEIEEDNQDEEFNIDSVSISNPEAAYIKKLLEILPSKYYEDYKLWYSVLCALNSISERFKCIALWFSKKSKSKFNKDDFDKTWDNITIRGGSSSKKLSKRSIIYWARKENPVKFQEISSTNYYSILIDTIMKKEGKIGHGGHAEILYAMFSHKYVHSTIVDSKRGKNSADCWYEFIMPEDNHRYGEVYKWKTDPDAIFLKKYIMKNYYAALIEGEKYIEKRIENINPETHEKMSKRWTAILKNFRAVKDKIDDITYVDKIIRAASISFRRDGFIEELDTATNMIGVANGVLKTGIKTKLIAKHHEHPIMLRTVASYIPYDPHCKAIIRIKEIFRQVYPEPDMCDYVWYLASTALDRRPITGRLLFIIGGGSNGKTVTMNFIQNAIGLDLCASLKMALLTGVNGKANEADSAFMQAWKKTFILFDEGSGSDIINSEKVKNMINCNKQSARDLYQSQMNISLYANGISSTNHNPIIRSTDTDDGLWRRMWFYKAKSKFTHNPDPTRSNEHKIDMEIEQVLVHDPVYLNATLSILTHYYEKFMSMYKGNLNNIPCETLVQETRIFRQQQDKALKYCYSNIVVSPGSTIVASDLGLDYSRWTQGFSGENITAIKAEEFLSISSLGRYRSGLEYIGIRLKSSGPLRARDLEIPYSEYDMKTTEERNQYNKDAEDYLAKKKEMSAINPNDLFI